MLDTDAGSSWNCRYVEHWLSSTPLLPGLSRLSTPSTPPPLASEVIPPRITSPPQPEAKGDKRKRSEHSSNDSQTPLLGRNSEGAIALQGWGSEFSRGTDLTPEPDIDAAGPYPPQRATNFPPPNFEGVFGSEPSNRSFGDMESDLTLRSPAPSLTSNSAISSKTNLKSKLEALQFNCTPAFTFHEMPPPEKTPPVVRELLANLSLSASGCGYIPASLELTLKSDPKLATEAIPLSMWAPKGTIDSEPSPMDLKLWELVQDIVKHTALLACQNAEESEYYPLVQKVLGGSKQNHTT